MTNEVKQVVATGTATRLAKMPNMAYGILLQLLLPLALAATLGLAFLWHCPDWSVGNGHWRFWRQLAWHVFGVGAFALALKIGWARWVKAAPFVFGGWFTLFVLAHCFPRVNGNPYLHICGISVDVMAIMPFTVALLITWIVMRFKVRIRTVVFGLWAVAVLLSIVSIVTNREGMERIRNYFRGVPISEVEMPTYIQERVETVRRTSSILAEANWFKSGDETSVRRLPGAATYSMPAVSSVLFGKWFLATVWLTWLAFAWSLVGIWRMTHDKAKRMFVLATGFGILIPVIAGPCECMRIIPMTCTSVPIVSYGGIVVLMTWLTVGVLTSLIESGEEMSQREGAYNC